jgi:protoheme IX farnesyltransferase
MELHLQRIAWTDYLALAKPRVVLLHLITAAAAMFLARGLPPLSILMFTLVGGALMVGSSNALNCYIDRDIDGMMLRTHNRPLPAGRLRPFQAMAFGVVTGFMGLLILGRLVGLAAAAMAAGALIYYIVVYTLWLKRRTSWSAVIGSGAGAFPPLIGWIAVTGTIGITPFILFAIVALWSPPHFWALAISRRNDFQSAGLGVMPARNTSRWIFAFSSLLMAVSILLVPVAHLGFLYLGTASVLGLVFLGLALRLLYKEDFRAARRLFSYSIVFLIVLFGAMLIDRLVFL